MSRLQDVTYVTSPFLRLVGEQESVAIFCCLGIRSNLLFPALWLMTLLMTSTWRRYFLQDQREIIPGLQFQEATVITLLELSDMNEELDQFHHNTKKKPTRLYCSWSEGNNSFKKITDFVKLSLHHENLSELEKGVEYLVENYTLLYFCSSITANSVPMLLNDYEEKKFTNFLGIITSLTGKNHSQP